MKFIPYLLIALSLLLFWGRTHSLQGEIESLKARDSIKSKQIALLRADMKDMKRKNCDGQWVIDEIERMFRGKNFVPLGIEGTYLVYETEE